MKASRAWTAVWRPWRQSPSFRHCLFVLEALATTGVTGLAYGSHPLSSESGVAVGMLAGGHFFIEDSAGPSEFAHAKLGRIVCAPHPRLDIFEMVAQGR